MNLGPSQLSKRAVPGATVAPATEVKLAKIVAPDGAANLMPPPTTALRTTAGRRSTSDVLAASNATPVQPEYASRRPITTPLTALGGATTVTPGTILKPPSLSSAGVVLQTPGAHTRGVGAVERSMNDTPSTVSDLDASKHDTVSQGDAGISDKPSDELFTASPGTALAADILATAIRGAPVEASMVTEELDAHVVSAGDGNRDEGNEGELYSRFAAAATPVSAKPKGNTASAKKTSAPTAGTKRKGKQLGSGDGEKIKSTAKAGVATHGCASGLNLDTQGVGALYSVLIPPAKKRKARRWLSNDQKTFVCGIGGCSRSYGSASSLCAHKRAHHPGWKEDRKRQLDVQVQTNAASDDDHRNASPEDEGADEAEGEDKEEDDDEGDDEDDAGGFAMGGGDDGDYDDMFELRIVPKDPEGLDQMFHVLCECAAMNPDDDEEEEEDDGGLFFDEDEVMRGAGADGRAAALERFDAMLQIDPGVDELIRDDPGRFEDDDEEEEEGK